jgi:hypothetical protein
MEQDLGWKSTMGTVDNLSEKVIQFTLNIYAKGHPNNVRAQ